MLIIIIIERGYDIGNISREEKDRIVTRNFKDFRDYFFVHEIYFSQEVCDLLYRYIETCIELIRKFKRSEEDVEKLADVWEQFKEDIANKIKKLLENEFRSYLGVS